jgi:hypothetical protein
MTVRKEGGEGEERHRPPQKRLRKDLTDLFAEMNVMARMVRGT